MGLLSVLPFGRRSLSRFALLLGREQQAGACAGWPIVRHWPPGGHSSLYEGFNSAPLRCNFVRRRLDRPGCVNYPPRCGRSRFLVRAADGIRHGDRDVASWQSITELGEQCRAFLILSRPG